MRNNQWQSLIFSVGVVGVFSLFLVAHLLVVDNSGPSIRWGRGLIAPRWLEIAN